MRNRLISTILFLGVLTACAGAPVNPGDASSSAPTATAMDDASPEPARSPSAEPTEQADPTDQAEPTEPMQPGSTIVAAESQFGTVLFDDTGQAIYLFDVETTSEPACYGECADAWPPVLTTGAPLAGPGVRAELLGTTPRTDGTSQVTYGGHPLYFYAHEGKNEVRCHDVFLDGGNWYALQPDGQRAP